MRIPNQKRLPGLDKEYATDDSPSELTETDEVRYFFYGKELPLEFGEMLHKRGKRGIVLLNERRVSGPRTGQLVAVTQSDGDIKPTCSHRWILTTPRTGVKPANRLL